MIVAPHRSWLDPACVVGACPRPVRFLMMERVYRWCWAHWFYRGVRAIPVEAEDGRGSLRGLREGLRALHRGQLVGIFPEGRVFPVERPGKLHLGAALLAIRGRAPVIPCGIVGSDRAWPHGRRWPGPARVRVRFAEPIPPPVRQDRESLERFMKRIENELKRLERGETAA